MSRGLGKTQYAVLDALAIQEDFVSLNELTIMVYHADRFMYEGMWSQGYCEDWSHTRAEYTAIQRAVRTLEKCGMVETRQEARGFFERPEDSRGGISHVKLARIKR